MIELRRVPWPIWVYSAVLLLGATLIEIKVHGPTSAKVLFPVLTLAWIYFLLQGVRWVWIVTVGICVVGLVPDAISGSLNWQGVASSLIGFTLLMLPVTRRYFLGDTPAVGA
jgi:hypothetical protein